MSIIHAQSTVVLATASGSADVVTLTGTISISDIVNTNTRTVTALIRVSSDGKMYKIENNVTTQIATVADWVRPTGSALNYHCRFTKSTFGNAPDVGTSGSWVACTIDRDYGFQHALADITHADTNIKIDISDDGGSTVLVTASGYNLEASRGVPV